MMLLISPAKTLDFASPWKAEHTQPAMLAESKRLIAALAKLSEKDIAKLMGISPKLAALNHARFRSFKTPFTAKNAKPAVLAFRGDVYDGLDADSLGKVDLAFAQKHLRILSGLYGLLRPLDLMQPYRLEMGTALKNPRGKNLYEFWGERITEVINKEKPGVVVNLASQEYFSAVRPAKLAAELLHIVFKERQKDGSLKVVGLHAKKARGRMAGFVIRNRLKDPKAMAGFTEGGYRIDKSLSSDERLVFVR